MKRILSIILAAVMMLSIAPVTNIFTDTDTAITANAATYYYVKSSSGLRLRKGPGTSYSTILTMPNGAKVKYLGSKSNGFYKVSYTKSGKTYTGWCSASYLKKSSSSSASLSSKDKQYLEYLFSNFYCEDYKYSYSDARRMAYDALFAVDYSNAITNFEYFGWSYSSYEKDYYSGTFKSKDPKNYVSKNGAIMYLKFSASKIDWILKNVYNVKPDHSMTGSCYGAPVFYYYNGYYYNIVYYPDADRVYYSISSSSLSNGYYYIKGKLYEMGYDTSSGTFAAKVKLKYVDGKKVWSIVHCYTYY